MRGVSLLKMINKMYANQALASEILLLLGAYTFIYTQLHGGDIKTETNEDAVVQFRQHRKYFLMTRRHAL